MRRAGLSISVPGSMLLEPPLDLQPSQWACLLICVVAKLVSMRNGKR